MAGVTGIGAERLAQRLDPSSDSHEFIGLYNDPASDLRAIIAVHHSRSGMAAGGVRMRAYETMDAALLDVKRLSEAMTYKLALAGLDYGGAKSVIIADPERTKRPELFRAFGRLVENLGGRYICGPDVGTTPQDMMTIAEETSHVRGLPHSGGSATATAFGVFHAIRAAARFRFGSDDLRGRDVAIQGAGAVGAALAEYLHKAGAALIVADVNWSAVQTMVQRFGARAVNPDAIMGEAVDILSPCALGAVLDEETIPHIKAGIICGAANNQLARTNFSKNLTARGILVVPDYVASAGGAIWAMQIGCDAADDVLARIEATIAGRCHQVFEKAEVEALSTHEAATLIAHAAIATESGLVDSYRNGPS